MTTQTKEIKIKTPYGVKNWSFVKKCFDSDEVAKSQIDTLKLEVKSYVEELDVALDKCKRLRHVESAYIELWSAIENGKVNSKFFKLRSRFRKTIQSKGKVGL